MAKTTTKFPRVQRMKVADLRDKKFPGNPHVATPEGMKQLGDQVETLGNINLMTYNVRTGHILGGNKRIDIYDQRGDKEVDVWCVDLPEEKERIAVIALNNHAGDFDAENLRKLTELIANSGETGMEDLELAGFKSGELEKILALVDDSKDGQTNKKKEAHKTLAETFLIPPFSTLDARQGYWQTRKAAWIALGLRGEVGRGGNLLKFSDTVLQPDADKRANKKLGKTFNTAEWIKTKGKKGFAQNIPGTDDEWTGTSIFDPVLCEAMYHWFCPAGGSVLDPFAGGVTRGAVAGATGHHYVGIDLSAEQIKANKKQWPEIKSPATSSTSAGKPNDPQWIVGDSRNVVALAKQKHFDMIFSCPPYADLEKYSDDPRDLSTLEYDSFAPAYRSIIKESCALLKPNRFAVFVVGEVREKNGGGAYRHFVPDTIKAFSDAGLQYYNEMILITSVGSLPIRAGRQFQASRKIGKTHQNVIVCYKGDISKIHETFGDMPELIALEQPETPINAETE